MHERLVYEHIVRPSTALQAPAPGCAGTSKMSSSS